MHEHRKLGDYDEQRRGLRNKKLEILFLFSTLFNVQSHLYYNLYTYEKRNYTIYIRIWIAANKLFTSAYKHDCQLIEMVICLIVTRCEQNISSTRFLL